MKQPLFSIGFLGLSLVSMALPAAARPEIASGDQLLNTNVTGCLARADQLIAELGVESDEGLIDRTGYFEDGSFRILCYGAGNDSLAVVFASHNQSLETASNFIQMALTQLLQNQSGPQNQNQAVSQTQNQALFQPTQTP